MKVVEKPYVKMWMEDGILHEVYTANAEIKLPQAKEMVQLRAEVSEGKHYPILCDLRLLKSAAKEARAFTSAEAMTNMMAVGIITGNAFSRALAHLFITVNQPSAITRVFTDVEPAKEWLLQFVRKN